MATGHDDPPSFGRDDMTTRALIREAIPRDTAKVIARELGCTHRQGRRIATGKVPQRLRVALIDLCDRFIAQRRTSIERAERELRELRYAAMVARAAARREQVASEAGAEAARLADGPSEPLVSE